MASRVSLAPWEETELERLRIDSRDPVRVSQVLSDLEPDTRYGWQVCAADEEEDPARVVCSKEQRFGTVGDEVLVIAGPPGSGTTVSIIISVRSGPDGENPSGWLQPDGTRGAPVRRDLPAGERHPRLDRIRTGLPPVGRIRQARGR